MRSEASGKFNLTLTDSEPMQNANLESANRAIAALRTQAAPRVFRPGKLKPTFH
ncbi:MAG: hypothetical protein LRZ84_23435 [Desertifilum sp.]|nr:hypothetical protein [Oscillatoria laete-virens]MCD8489607.1 hypothetical protein [Desertifilum sp.]MDL5054735.1 hypothetical protein [Oscillatoria laete-virens NRMC-F 0139]